MYKINVKSGEWKVESGESCLVLSDAEQDFIKFRKG
jgi:hypothetical protein